MNPTLIATLAGLTTALCWGTSDWLSARSSKKMGILEINFAVQIISMVWMGVLWLAAGLHVGNTEQVVRIALSSILITAAYLLFLKALSKGVVGIVVPLANVYPLFTIILTTIFLDTHISSGQLIAMLTIVAGAAILAYEQNSGKRRTRPWYVDTGLAFGAAIVWGAAFFVLDPVVTQVSWQTVSIVGEVASFIFALIILVIAQPKQAEAAVKRSFQHVEPFIIGTIGTTGIVAIYYGSAKAGNVLIPTVLSAVGPLVASLWAALFDHEKLDLIKRAGAVIVVAGIIILNLT